MTHCVAKCVSVLKSVVSESQTWRWTASGRASVSSHLGKQVVATLYLDEAPEVRRASCGSTGISSGLLVADKLPKTLLPQYLSFCQAAGLLDLAMDEREFDDGRHTVHVPDSPKLIRRDSPSASTCKRTLMMRVRKLVALDLLRSLSDLHESHIRRAIGRKRSVENW